MQEKLAEVVRLAHDSAADVLSYIVPLKTAVSSSAHSEELQRILESVVEKKVKKSRMLSKKVFRICEKE
ncbi:MAG: hypothetical protein AOA66_0401 [Candidatus Bathyarchaeota archaeon BA2]|nr:MAG: hypothetical protein AOA66_0401 [Candidatus Bathyarchaeota archaeon BA2]